ncbi:MAG TPA: carboxypeptidase regulatory-like domain-containing protein [Gemmatimonadaceae bacterium]|nr:carboxypeptidase regulatory-like domain-containing protein [Gemmatimonadaceae bacterium]
MKFYTRVVARRHAGLVFTARRLAMALGIAAASAAVSVAPAPLAAQATVSITGRVTAAGRPIGDAQVGVKDRETNQVRGTRTSADGDYTIVGLQPGSYDVKVQRIGFAPVSQEVRLLVGQRATLNFTMQEAAAALSGVQVTATPRATFEAQRTDISAPVVTAEIQNLPLNTRNTLNLAAIVPGIKTYAPTAGRSLPSAGSLADLRFYNFYLDGVEWKSMFNGNLVGIPQTGSPIPQEALREFRVYLNPYDAELTRGGSYIISGVTQRGTNDMKGSAFVYYQNNDLRALDEFQRRSRTAAPTTYKRADYDRQQLGFNLRGPIIKDKLFFAGSYELGNTNDNIQVVPGRPAFRPTVWDQYAGDFSAPTKNHTGVLRLTSPFTEKHTGDMIYAGRYYDSETFFGASESHDAGLTAKYSIHSLQLRDTYTPTGSIVNQASVHLLAWNHNEEPLVPGPRRLYPSIAFGRNTFPLVLRERHLRFIDKLTYTLPGGKHILGGGVELTHVNTSSFLPSNKDGFFEYRTDTSSAPFRATIGVGFFNPNSTEDAKAEATGWVAGGYLQDEWRATQDLTFTLGLRYDAEINTLANDFKDPWSSNAALVASLPNFINNGDRKNDLNNLAPRVSFSWDVTGKDRTFIRGGWGIMNGRFPSTNAFGEVQAAGWRSYTIQNPGNATAAQLRQQVISGGVALTPNITLVAKDIKQPQTMQASIGIGQVLTEDLVLNIDYVDQQGRDLYVNYNANPLIPAVGTTPAHRKINTGFGNVTVWDDFGKAKFRALTGSLTWERSVNPLKPKRANVAYTLGFYKAQFEGLGGYADPSQFVMQNTAGDERHRVVFSGIYALPFGFQFSGIGIFASSHPFAVTDGRDLNNSGLVTDDWPNGQRTAVTDGGWDDMYKTIDFRLARNFSIGGTRAQLSAEVFNLFNWVNWAGYNGTLNDLAGNRLGNYGLPNGSLAPRQAQLGIRYDF